MMDEESKPEPEPEPESSDEEESSPKPESEDLERERHVAFLGMMGELLPGEYQSQEINRLTLAYFVISGLDFLRSLHLVDKDAIARWVLSFQVLPANKAGMSNGQFYGFCGSTSSQYPLAEDGAAILNHSHLASTYCALAILKIIGHSLASINSKSISTSLGNLQQDDGSFLPIHMGAETDLRFTYCAAAICSMLEDWSGIDQEKARDFIVKCQTYDGGFGMVPGSESHGGGTYCAVASLRLMGYIEDDILSNGASSSIINIPLVLEWCLQRQAADGGFQGRLNKPSDTCYAFWVGSVLRILGAYKMVDGEALRGFLCTCQSKYGGFSKYPCELPDLYHSYYGFTAFSLLEEPYLGSLCPELGITDDAAQRI